MLPPHCVLMIGAVLLTTGSIARAQDVIDYADHKVVRAELRDHADLVRMRQISNDCFSHEPVIGATDWRIAPDKLPELDGSGISYVVLVDDLGAVIDAERRRLAGGGARGTGSWYDDYKNLQAINDKIDELAALRPDLVTVSTIGTSVEGRSIRSMQITGGPGNPADKPSILYNACQHSREWIAVMTAMYVAEHLIAEYDTDPFVRELVDRIDFRIVPMVNPDGYVHTWGPNRLWRKNRRDNGNGTFGVDLNRNWSFQWGQSGSSGDPGSTTYRGPAPFSEPESSAVRDLALSLPNLLGHLDIHNYGQDLFRTWGYTSTLPPDIALINTIGDDVAGVISAVHGETYVHGPGGITSGTAKDWFYGDQDVISWTLELRDEGTHNFLLPADQILPTCEENWPGVLRFADLASKGMSVTFARPWPDFMTPGESETVPLTIEPLTSRALDAATARLRHRIGTSAAFASTPMTHVGADDFELTVPTAPVGALVESYIEIDAVAGGTWRYPPAAPIQLRQTRIAATVFEDDFESELGWTVTNQTLTDGPWDRGVPVGGGDRGDPPTDFDGSGACRLTDNVDGNSDVDGGPTILTSPLLDMSGLNDPYISYARWMTADPVGDEMIVELSGDDAGTWSEIERAGDGPGWDMYTFRVTDVLAPTTQMRIQFSVADVPSNSITEAAIDQFRVYDVDPKPGDLNSDGVVNVSDILELLTNWGPCAGCAADLNSDGAVDVLDLLIMLANWG